MRCTPWSPTSRIFRISAAESRTVDRRSSIACGFAFGSSLDLGSQRAVVFLLEWTPRGSIRLWTGRVGPGRCPCARAHLPSSSSPSSSSRASWHCVLLCRRVATTGCRRAFGSWSGVWRRLGGKRTLSRWMFPGLWMVVGWGCGGKWFGRGGRGMRGWRVKMRGGSGLGCGCMRWEGRRWEGQARKGERRERGERGRRRRRCGAVGRTRSHSIKGGVGRRDWARGPARGLPLGLRGAGWRFPWSGKREMREKRETREKRCCCGLKPTEIRTTRH